MFQSVCILGRQPALGLAELESLFGAGHVTQLSSQVAGLTIAPGDVDFGRLGGSTRLGRVLAEIPGTNWTTVEKYIANLVPEYERQLPEGKLQLGISTYGFDITPAKLTATGLTLKKRIRASGRSVRLVPNNGPELNTAQVLHNHLTGPTGWELLFIRQGDRTILAQTIAVQDIDSYTLRDRGRPKRDARVGMLPPKLAQIIINLATGQADMTSRPTVLDPFCGTGVVLIEASLMGFSAYGSDIDPRMVAYSQENLQWLHARPAYAAQLHASVAPVELGDATEHSWSPTPQFVAGETYLGRPFTVLPDEQTLGQNMADVNTILTKFLRNIYGQLAPGTRLCLGIPAWKTRSNRFKHLPLIDQISDLGYNRLRFEHVRDDELLYYREDQIVARELLVITRK